MYQINLIQVILILFASFWMVQNEKRTFYFCDSESEETTLKSMLNQNFFIKNDEVYLLTNKKSLNFKVPLMPRNDKLFLNGPFFEVDSISNPNEKEKILGYYIDRSLGPMEIYKNDAESLKLIKYDLNSYAKIERIAPEIKKANRHLIKIIYSSSYTVFYQGIKSSLLIAYQNSSRYMILAVNSTSLEHFEAQAATFREVKHFVSSLVYHQFENDNQFHDNKTLIEIDERNYFHLYQIDLKVDFENSGTKLLFNTLIHEKVSVSEFFSCPNLFIEKLVDLKGIYSDIYNKKFYIFIKHYYLAVKTDLVEKKFTLSKDDFKRGIGLSLNDGDFRFENKVTKYVKTFSEKTKLVLYDSVFDMQSNDNGELTFKLTEFKRLPDCLGQTLSVTNFLFCFNENTYSVFVNLNDENKVLPKTAHQIADLIQKINPEYKNEDKKDGLKFTFNYQSNGEKAFVLMTNKNLYIFQYKSVRVDLESYKLIVNAEKGELKQLDNNLFTDVVEEPTESSNTEELTTVPTFTNEITSESVTTKRATKNSNLFNYLKYIIFSVILILILIYLIVCFVTKKKKKSKKSETKNMIINAFANAKKVAKKKHQLTQYLKSYSKREALKRQIVPVKSKTLTYKSTSANKSDSKLLTKSSFGDITKTKTESMPKYRSFVKY